MKKSLVSLLAVFSMLSVFSADLILESGNYRVVFSDKPELYSITHIWYQNAELGTRSGFYGNILAPENGKYIGAGHTETISFRFTVNTHFSVALEFSCGRSSVPAPEEIIRGTAVPAELIEIKTSVRGILKAE